MLQRHDPQPSLYAALAASLSSSWPLKARPSQIEPAGDWWSTWLLLGGRGAGKTRSGAEWTLNQVRAGAGRIALIAPTAADARDTMVEGQSGILACAPDWERPDYEPSKRRLTWPNGAVATLFSAEEPERLRGPQHDAMWADEIGSWQNATDTWDMAMFGLRLGNRPRCCATTTPRPIALIKDLVSREGRDVVISRSRTDENSENLAPTFLSQIVGRYQGTRLGRQELGGELLDDIEGALWTRAMVDAARVKEAPDLQRIVVAVDPSGTKGDDKGDAIGIVVAGKGVDGKAYVLADRTCKLSPDGWGKRAVAAYHEFEADRIVAERNFGGAMVEHVIRTVDPKVAYKEVTASRGKVARAEPVAALYEQGRVKHVGAFPELEDQLCEFTADGFAGSGSPDRADALIWAASELMIAPAVPAVQIGKMEIR